MIVKKTYRGYDLEVGEDGTWVGKGGEQRHFQSEEKALQWIDEQKRQSALKSK